MINKKLFLLSLLIGIVLGLAAFGLFSIVAVIATADNIPARLWLLVFAPIVMGTFFAYLELLEREATKDLLDNIGK